MKYETFKDYLKARYKGPYVATDIAPRYEQDGVRGTVLIERKNPPYGISVAGGIAEDMQLYKNAIKELKEETGLDIVIDSPEKPLCVLSDPLQDPRAFIISVSFTGTATGKIQPHPDEDAKRAFFVPLSELEEMLKKEDIWAFQHHRKILQKFLEYEKQR